MSTAHHFHRHFVLTRLFPFSSRQRTASSCSSCVTALAFRPFCGSAWLRPSPPPAWRWRSSSSRWSSTFSSSSYSSSQSSSTSWIQYLDTPDRPLMFPLEYGMPKINPPSDMSLFVPLDSGLRHTRFGSKMETAFCCSGWEFEAFMRAEAAFLFAKLCDIMSSRKPITVDALLPYATVELAEALVEQHAAILQTGKFPRVSSILSQNEASPITNPYQGISGSRLPFALRSFLFFKDRAGTDVKIKYLQDEHLRRLVIEGEQVAQQEEAKKTERESGKGKRNSLNAKTTNAAREGGLSDGDSDSDSDSGISKYMTEFAPHIAWINALLEICEVMWLSFRQEEDEKIRAGRSPVFQGPIDRSHLFEQLYYSSGERALVAWAQPYAIGHLWPSSSPSLALSAAKMPWIANKPEARPQMLFVLYSDDDDKDGLGSRSPRDQVQISAKDIRSHTDFLFSSEPISRHHSTAFRSKNLRHAMLTTLHLSGMLDSLHSGKANPVLRPTENSCNLPIEKIKRCTRNVRMTMQLFENEERHPSRKFIDPSTALGLKRFMSNSEMLPEDFESSASVATCSSDVISALKDTYQWKVCDFDHILEMKRLLKRPVRAIEAQKFTAVHYSSRK